ncbi:MAG: hypothetical protein ACO25B_08915 [Chitinophagaceae bacterium]
MKKNHACLWVIVLILIGSSSVPLSAQQYKIRQTTTMMGMESESTVYVKGMRKRTESAGYMDQFKNIVTIEQCDKQRTVTLNTKKKMYFIEPFGADDEEVIDEDVKPTGKPKPEPVTTKKGGIINMYYQVTDTGERKKMYGFTARHIWTSQKIKPSPDACSMKDSLILKTDGWYIDLPEFNCPVRYRPSQINTGGTPKPECRDRFVTRRSGRGKLGFPLIEKRTMKMGGGPGMSSDFETRIETVELITGKLDSMLFEIPPGFTEARTAEELQEKFDAQSILRQYTDQPGNKDEMPGKEPAVKKAGTTRIGVLEPAGEGSFEAAALQQHIVNRLQEGSWEPVAVSSEEDARSKSCDLLLDTKFTRFKQASKVGGLLKAIKNTDPNAASSFNIEGNMIVTRLADGQTVSEQNLSGKYEGKPDDAAGKALDEGCQKVIRSQR